MSVEGPSTPPGSPRGPDRRSREGRRPEDGDRRGRRRRLDRDGAPAFGQELAEHQPIAFDGDVFDSQVTFQRIVAA